MQTRDTAGILTFPTDAGTLFMIVILILPVAIMASAVSVGAAIRAKSTREAMSYLTPGFLIVMLLGMVTFIPDVEKSAAVALVPFANFSKMLRQVLAGEWSWSQYGITLAANLTYAAIATVFAVKKFTDEKVLFRS
jgi:sodium transport system permease protein